MGFQTKVTSFFVMVLLFVWWIPSFSQYSPADKPLGTVRFIGKSTKLTRQAKVKLDNIVSQIKDDTTMHVKAISFYKDFCDKCGDRSWKRANAVLAYLSKHGIADDRLNLTNELDGELNKVDLFLIAPIKGHAPYPVINKKKKQHQNDKGY